MITDILIEKLKNGVKDIGRELLRLRESGSVQGKWQGSQFKADADVYVERQIINLLDKLKTNVLIVSEENINSYSAYSEYRHWLIDPIDGTASFCEGYPGFVCQIALMEDARPVLAIVYAPALDLMYVGKKGAGASLNGKQLSLSGKKHNVVLIDNYPIPRGLADYVTKKLPCDGYVESGSIGLKICRVADGAADLFVKDVIFHTWDSAPGHLILEEAGGNIVDLNGEPLNYRKQLNQTRGLISAHSQQLTNKVTALLKRNI